jgi:phosphodiesterase/alkaline phosphatase D-like protein
VSTSTPVNLATAMITTSTGSVVSHTVHLSGLAASTTYFFVVESADASNNVARSAQFSFMTAAVDVTPPVISSTTAMNITTSTADIAWGTNEPATSKVYMSTSTPVNLATATNVLNNSLLVSHVLHLSGLTASTTYFFVVESKDAANNTATSTEHSFVTIP